MKWQPSLVVLHVCGLVSCPFCFGVDASPALLHLPRIWPDIIVVDIAPFRELRKDTHTYCLSLYSGPELHLDWICHLIMRSRRRTHLQFHQLILAKATV